MLKSDFALQYEPLMSGKEAWQKVRRWIDYNPRLRQALAEAGYREPQKSLTPRQASLLYHYLGEP